MRLLITLVFLLGTCYTVVSEKTRSRIVGGAPAAIEEFPFVASVHYHFLGVIWIMHCGGSLITVDTVLSAAHCFTDVRHERYKAILGSSYTYGNVDASHHIFSQVINHEDYNGATAVNDVSVLKLRERAVLSHRINLARLAGGTFVLHDNAELTVLGYGVTAMDQFSESLNHVTVNVINQEVCAERYRELKSQPGFEHWPAVVDGMMCAGGGRGACDGDSGGPLLVGADTVVGIVSWSYRCGDPYYPGVNVRVSTYSDWIVRRALNLP